MLCIAYMLCLAQVARGGLCMMSRHAISFTFVLTLRSCVWSQPSPLDLTPKPQKWALHSIVAAVCCQSAAVSVAFQVVIRLAAWTTSREAVSKAEHILCFGCRTLKVEAIQVRSCCLHPSWLRLHLKKRNLHVPFWVNLNFKTLINCYISWILAMNLERGQVSCKFIPDDSWSSS